jgi:hypothetical protein
VNTNGCIYNASHPDPEYCKGFNCEAVAVSDSFFIENAALAEASAHCLPPALHLHSSMHALSRTSCMPRQKNPCPEDLDEIHIEMM